MELITTEDAWLSCDHPLKLCEYCLNKLETQRFRWLAAEWGGRIRHLFDEEDLPWFDAFAAWVAGEGLHPRQVCQPREYYPLDRPKSEVEMARSCAKGIRMDNPMYAATCAGHSASDDYPLTALPTTDSVQIEAHRQAWWSAMERMRRVFVGSSAISSEMWQGIRSGR